MFAIQQTESSVMPSPPLIRYRSVLKSHPPKPSFDYMAYTNRAWVRTRQQLVTIAKESRENGYANNWSRTNRRRCRRFDGETVGQHQCRNSSKGKMVRVIACNSIKLPFFFFFWEEELNTDEGLGTRGNHARVYLALKRNDGISHL